MSDYGTPSTGPDQWFVAALVLLYALSVGKELHSWARIRNRGEQN